MSYSHTQRRKTVKRFKKQFGDGWHSSKWYPKFREYVEQIVKERLGPPIGTLEDIMDVRREAKKEDHENS